jgi:ferritin-like metal-binding protein YciE
VEEADDIVEEFKDDIALDAAIVAAAQKAEHYEIASYGSMVAFAERLGLKKVGQLLNSTLEEEKGADAKLSALAEEVLNAAAEA